MQNEREKLAGILPQNNNNNQKKPKGIFVQSTEIGSPS
jgi:hypothetical protein